MDSLRKTAIVAGSFYLLTFVTSIPALALYSPVLNDTNYIVGAGADTRVLWGGLLEVLLAFSGIGTAVALYPVVKRQNEAVALGFVTSRVLESSIVAIGIVSLLAVVTLRHDSVGATGADAASLITTGKALVAVHNWTFLIGPGVMPGVNALCLGYLLYKSRLVPRIIPTIGLIGAPLIFVSAIAELFGAFSQISSAAALLTVPIAFWEFAVGVWMIVKGFRPSPITAAMSTAGASPAEQPATA